MVVICEDCAKKYNVDETKIKGERARFSCRECGHIIVVQKPKASSVQQNRASHGDDGSGSKQTASQSQQSGASPAASKDSGHQKKSEYSTGTTLKKTRKGKGIAIGFYLLFALSVGFIAIVAVFAFLYLKYIPQIMNEQIDLRTSVIATSFSGSVKQPLLVRNYLQVNNEAKRVSALPGVAYAAVVNDRGIPVAGFFSDLTKFDQVFATEVKSSGFPRSVIEKNSLQGNEKEKSNRFVIGGQVIQDRTVALADTGGSVHVGIYVSEVNQAIKDALLSPLSLSLIGGIFLAGMLMFLLIGRLISRPITELTDVVNRISLGELELSIDPKGPREIRELGTACERMRFSIKSAIERLKR